MKTKLLQKKLSVKNIFAKNLFKTETFHYFLTISLLSIFLFTGCPLEVTITSSNQNSHETSYTINTTAEKPVIELVTSFDNSTAPADARIFDSLEIEKSLLKCGFTEPKARAFKPDPSSEELTIEANASDEKFPFIKKYFTEKPSSSFEKIEITLSPEILQKLITSQNSIIQKYADLLMAPCFTGEEISETEYRELVASLYGNKIADELLRGTVKIILCDGITRQKAEQCFILEIPLIEILTLQKEKTYVISR